MLKEELFDLIRERLEDYQYSSMTYTDFTEVSDYDVIHNDEKLILLSGYNSKKLWINYHFAANSVDDLLEAMDLSKLLHISFVPKEWADTFKQRGFEVYAVFNDYNNTDISNIPPCEAPELLTEAECEAAALVTQSCCGQSRGFEGETAEFMKSWINGVEPSAVDSEAKDCAVLIHRENSEIVGVLCTTIYGHESPKGPIVWVREIAVDPKHQRKGIAGKLILQALNYGKERGATRAFLSADECNEHAIQLYEKYGFVGNKEEGQIDMILPK